MNWRKNKNISKVLATAIIPIFLSGCGSSDTPPYTDEGATVNLEKLVGTPFEGVESGDLIDPDIFLCGQYRTDTIDEFPIKIFMAYFLRNDEELAQEVLDDINEDAGFEMYALTDTWSDDVRVIYQAQEFGAGNGTAAVGQTDVVFQSFNGKSVAENQTADWSIMLIKQVGYTTEEKENGVRTLRSPVLKHELGHATGIYYHALIDYDNDSLLPLEDRSLMLSSLSRSPTYSDYDYMMSHQSKITQSHLSEQGDIIYEPSCPSE